MTASELIAAINKWVIDPDNPAYCDALCEAAEYLKLPNREYSAEFLIERLRLAADDL